MKDKYIEPEFIKDSNIVSESLSFFVSDLGAEFTKFNLKPLGGTRIDWNEQGDLKRYNVDEHDLLLKIDNFLSDKDEMVNVYWDDGSVFDMKADVKFVRKYLDRIDEETFTYWIASSSYKWIIESYNGIEVVIKWLEKARHP